MVHVNFQFEHNAKPDIAELVTNRINSKLKDVGISLGVQVQVELGKFLLYHFPTMIDKEISKKVIEAVHDSLRELDINLKPY